MLREISVECFDGKNNIELLDTFEKYQTYVNKVCDGNVNTDSEYYQKLSSYTKSFFETNSLVVIYHRETSYDTVVSVTDIEYSGSKIAIVLASYYPYSISGDAIVPHGIIVEIAKDSNLSEVEYRVEKRYSWG